MTCPKGHRFPRQWGIPRFVISNNLRPPVRSPVEALPPSQLDSHTGVPISSSRVRRCLGEGLWRDLVGKQVLECGSGARRFTEVLLERGAYVTSVDLSDAVEANVENFPPTAHHRVAAADILQLPFAPQQYDVVFCLGVIQHTPGPEVTIRRLYEQVKPGGVLDRSLPAVPVMVHQERSLVPWGLTPLSA